MVACRQQGCRTVRGYDTELELIRVCGQIRLTCGRHIAFALQAIAGKCGRAGAAGTTHILWPERRHHRQYLGGCVRCAADRNGQRNDENADRSNYFQSTVHTIFCAKIGSKCKHLPFKQRKSDVLRLRAGPVVDRRGWARNDHA